jgi:hypothetical protein
MSVSRAWTLHGAATPVSDDAHAGLRTDAWGMGWILVAALDWLLEVSDRIWLICWECLAELWSVEESLC